MTTKIIGLGGSLRRESATTAAMQIALDSAMSYGVEVECIDMVNTPLPFFQGTYDLDDYDASERTVINHFLAKIDSADGIIFASPTYHNTISGVLKNALEILEIGRENLSSRIAGKAVGLITVQGGTSGTGNNTITTMLLATRAMGAWVVPTMVSIPSSWSAFTTDGQATNPANQKRLKYLGTEVARASEMLALHWRVS